MTAPDADPCNEDTLVDEPCEGGCGRRLHRMARGRSRFCTEGHPVHAGFGRCPGCLSRKYRQEKRLGLVVPRPPLPAEPVAPPVKPRAAGQPLCAGADPEMFFVRDIPGRPANHSQRERDRLRRVALMYCAQCPLLQQCATDADQNLDSGLRAGALRNARSAGAVGSYTWHLLIPGAPEPRVGRAAENRERWTA